ncbi:MAG: NUDIX hydrolase [Syntrophaceae bacterium]|nr:NUDIX hydrolase [Syntrophaceae bacterium]
MNPPRDAATVIIVRNSERGQSEIFLMRRHSNQSFMGGAYVFPGGRLDETDCDPAFHPFIDGLAVGDAGRFLQEPDLPGETALGLCVAAIRETFEEAGVLLARSGSGEPIDFADAGTADRFIAHRRSLNERKTTFIELGRRENLRFSMDRLIPFSHWITPDIESKRFDTRFFLAWLPDGQVPVHDNRELVESRWLTPEEALRLHERKEILLMPPTLKSMEELSACRTADELFAAAKQREIFTILPQAFSEDGGFGVKLPHDSEYTIAGYKQPHRPGESSRIVAHNGIWKTFCV